MRIITAKDVKKGIEKAKEILYKDSDSKTVIFLSGGSTPAPFYRLLAKEKRLKVGALAMVDDRYSFHEQYSNEFMIKESGLIQFVEKSDGAFFSILEYGQSIRKTAQKYDNDVRFLLSKFKKRIAILGIGVDGHIASLPPDSKLKIQELEFVSFLRSFPIEPKVPRITLNLNALSLMDLLVVLAFGSEKKEGIKIAIKTFFKSKIAKKAILITDQKI